MSGVKKLPEKTLAFSFKNKIINGSFLISQRGYIFYANNNTVVQSVDTADLWRLTVGPNSGKWTALIETFDDAFLQSNILYDFKKCINLTVNGGAQSSLSANSRAFFQTSVDESAVRDLQQGCVYPQDITLSFWVRSEQISGTFVVELIKNVGDNNNWVSISKSYTIDSPTPSFAKKVITFPFTSELFGSYATKAPSSSYPNAFILRFWLVAGTDYTSGGTLNQNNWQTFTGSASLTANRATGQVNMANTISNKISFTGIQLERGRKATEYEFLPEEITKYRCDQYYETSYGDNRYPGATNLIAGAKTIFFDMTTAVSASNYQGYGSVEFTVPKKSSNMTIKIYSITGMENRVSLITAANWIAPANTVNSSANVTINQGNEKGFLIRAINNTNGFIQTALFHWTADVNFIEPTISNT